MRALFCVVLGLTTAACVTEKEEAPSVSTAVRPQTEEAPAPRTKGRPRAKRPAGATTEKGTAVLRAGARRLEAYRLKKYEVQFEADRKLRMKAVDQARGAARVGAVVGPLERWKPERMGAEAAAVPDAEEIVAVALARQLVAMGWRARVGVNDGPAGDKVARTEEVKDLLTRFRFTGQVAFWNERVEDGARGVVQGKLEVLGADGASVHQSEVLGAAQVTKAEEAKVTRRIKRAQQQALGRFVTRYLADPELGQALARVIRAARKP